MSVVKDAQKWVNKVVGVTFEGRQDTLRKLFEENAGAVVPNTNVILNGYLEREPKNPYDENAIKVFGITADGDDLQVGYLNKVDAKFIADRGLKIYPDDIKLNIRVYVDVREVEQQEQFSATVEFYTATKNVQVENAL